MFRSYKYRLYPTKAQQRALEEMLDAYRELYNAALEERREAWHRHRISVRYYDQSYQLKEIRTLRPDFARWSFSTAQYVLLRLDKAFKAFFRRVKAGEAPGYPRFKSRSQFNSVEFTATAGAPLKDGRLRVQGVGPIKVKWHRPIPEDATVKTRIVKREANGKWYVFLILDVPDVTPPVHEGEAVGVDLGVSTLVALSTGECIPAPQYFQAAQARLRRQQRRLARRMKFSKRWRKARRQVAKTHHKIANQRKDRAHKLSRRLAIEFSLIAVEDLNLQALSRSMLAKSIRDAGWSHLLRGLTYKAAETGATVVKVDPALTSQRCSTCETLVPKTLQVRIHRCPQCGLVIDRDVNAARNILKQTRLLSERDGQAST